MTPNATNRLASSLLALASLVIGGLVWYLRIGCTGDGRESFGDKHEWSIMQAIEARHTGAAISAPEFTEEDGYRIMCVPGVTGERVWIMLNPHSAPYYKQIPHSDFALSKDQLFEIVRSQHPISTVEECLSTHVRPQQ
jgi:hypothetical protein